MQFTATGRFAVCTDNKNAFALRPLTALFHAFSILACRSSSVKGRCFSDTNSPESVLAVNYPGAACAESSLCGEPLVRRAACAESRLCGFHYLSFIGSHHPPYNLMASVFESRQSKLATSNQKLPTSICSPIGGVLSR